MSVCVCVQPCLPRELDFSRVSFFFMQGPRETMTCLQTCCEQVVAGGHSTYYQGMANEEPGSTVL